MELTSVTSIACIVPTNDKEVAYTSSSFIPPAITYLQQDNGYQINAKDGQEMLTWNVNHVAKLENIPEHETLINYALNGFDVASLSMSVCNGPTQDMNQARKLHLNSVFQILETKLTTMPDIKIEFAYICFHDQGCYDLRKELDRSNESMIERGMEGIMKPAKLKDIWNNALRGTSWPSILTIKLTDLSKHTVGRLTLIDLLHPRFSSLLSSGKDKSYYSFKKLVNAINAITTVGYVGKLSLDNCFLTKELEKYIIGHNKLSIFGYMNDKMVSEIHWRETKSLLDLMQALKDMPVRMLPNPSTKEVVDNKNLKNHTSNIIKQNKLLKSNLENLQKINQNLKVELQEKDIKFRELNQLGMKEFEYLKLTIEHYASDCKSGLEQLESVLKKLDEKNNDIKELEIYNLEINKRLKDTEIDKERINELENTIHKISIAGQRLQEDYQHLINELEKQRQEKIQFITLYEKESKLSRNLESQLKDEKNERKHIENRLEKLKERDDNSLIEFHNEVENIRKEFKQKETYLVENLEFKKKRFLEKAQAKMNNLEIDINKKEEEINKLLSKLEKFESNHE